MLRHTDVKTDVCMNSHTCIYIYTHIIYIHTHACMYTHQHTNIRMYSCFPTCIESLKLGAPTQNDSEKLHVVEGPVLPLIWAIALIFLLSQFLKYGLLPEK